MAKLVIFSLVSMIFLPSAQSHPLEKSHLSVIKMDIKNMMQDILGYMSKFGNVVKISPNENNRDPSLLHSAIVQYETEEEARKALDHKAVHRFATLFLGSFLPVDKLNRLFI